MSVSGKNMEAIAKAKADHNQRCPGPATAVKMHPIDIERCGWEDGDVIVGLVVQSDPTQGTGAFRVVCGLNDPEDIEITEAVGEEVTV